MEGSNKNKNKIDISRENKNIHNYIAVLTSQIAAGNFFSLKAGMSHFKSEADG